MIAVKSIRHGIRRRRPRRVGLALAVQADLSDPIWQERLPRGDLCPLLRMALSNASISPQSTVELRRPRAGFTSVMTLQAQAIEDAAGDTPAFESGIVWIQRPTGETLVVAAHRDRHPRLVGGWIDLWLVTNLVWWVAPAV